ncbi:hypothetical protein RUM43_008213 [Polyplax serrata]|uniref:Uncharacterized protein n=1 Tax=Polyplax serrata TaxID=468196 RepID=A0AAN8PNF1_POLSC
MTSDFNSPRIDSYRFSMANLEESQDVDLDAILGELSALETQCDQEIAGVQNSKRISTPVVSNSTTTTSLTHSRSCSEGQRMKLDADEDRGSKHDGVGRTESPDNDSAFSDNVSMLSSESSASSGGSSGASKTSSGLGIDSHTQQTETANRAKAEKIRIALEKMKLASVRKLFIKAFTSDGSTKSLLVDEKMTCGYVTRLLADKNHVSMEPKWAIIEHLPDLYMERIYEDHELLVDNLMMWTRDSKNKIIFNERMEKYQLFATPENFLLSSTDILCDYDDHSRAMLLEEFFSATSNTVPEISGPLYLKADSKKGWKKFHFVLRASGLYYYPKEKSKSSKDLVCLTSFDINEVYYGVGWKKKFKSPTDFCFAIKHPRLQQPKSTKYIKYLCAEDEKTLQKWVMGIRIAKYGRQLLENYRSLLDDLAQEDLDLLAHARSCSVASIAQTSQPQTPDRFLPNYDLTQDISEVQERTLTRRDSVNSRGSESRASSSSSSGCLSDGTSCVEQGFECDFPGGTIKRKPSVNPKLPLTSMTRQLKEVGETVDSVDATAGGTLTRGRSLNDCEEGKLSRNGTLTRSSCSRQSWRRSQTSDDSGSNSGTLKRRRSLKKDRKTEISECKAIVNDTPKTVEFKGLDNRVTLEEVNRNLNEAMNTLLMQKDSLCRDESSSVFEEALERNLENISDNASSFGDEEDKLQNNEFDELLPPPAPEMFQSSLSLSSLPPPPPQSELPVYDESELTCSSLSLASLPPFPTSTPRVSSPKSNLSTPISSGGATPVNVLSPEKTPTNRSPALSPPATLSPKVPPKPIINKNVLMNVASTAYYSQIQSSDSPVRFSPKKISFNFVPEEVTDSSKKPLPPKRSDSTRLTSPKKIASKESTLVPPPTDFLKDLQRVMRKKWQVAQKCKLDTSTTPHEVLGFRDPPPTLPDYKETNVSNWVQEHYGVADNLYENVYLLNVANGDTSPPLPPPPVELMNRTTPPVTHNMKAPLSMIDENSVYSFSDQSSRSSLDGSVATSIASKKRPPPPPPKRSETTQLTKPRFH